MKKPVLALMVSAIAFGGMLSTAQADTTTVTGGTVNLSDRSLTPPVLFPLTLSIRP